MLTFERKYQRTKRKIKFTVNKKNDRNVLIGMMTMMMLTLAICLLAATAGLKAKALRPNGKKNGQNNETLSQINRVCDDIYVRECVSNWVYHSR